jgi:hypothetical protein
MKILILSFLIIHWSFGLLWWKKNVYKKVTGSNYNEIWEAVGLWAAFFGGIFIFLFNYKEN